MKKTKYPPLQSPHTNIYGKRKVFYNVNNIKNLKTKPKTNTTYETKHIEVLPRRKLVIQKPHTNKILAVVTTKIKLSYTTTYKYLTTPHTIKSILAHPYLKTYKQNNIRLVRKKTKNLFATTEHKHKPMKTKLYINITNTISSYIYVKEIKTHTKNQCTLDIYIRKTKPKNNECSHTHHKATNLTYGNHCFLPKLAIIPHKTKHQHKIKHKRRKMKTMETKGITKTHTLTPIRMIISKYININSKPHKPIHQKVIIAYLCNMARPQLNNIDNSNKPHTKESKLVRPHLSTHKTTLE